MMSYELRKIDNIKKDIKFLQKKSRKLFIKEDKDEVFDAVCMALEERIKELQKDFQDNEISWQGKNNLIKVVIDGIANIGITTIKMDEAVNYLKQHAKYGIMPLWKDKKIEIHPLYHMVDYVIKPLNIEAYTSDEGTWFIYKNILFYNDVGTNIPINNNLKTEHYHELSDKSDTRTKE